MPNNYILVDCLFGELHLKRIIIIKVEPFLFHSLIDDDDDYYDCIKGGGIRVVNGKRIRLPQHTAANNLKLATTSTADHGSC